MLVVLERLHEPTGHVPCLRRLHGRVHEPLAPGHGVEHVLGRPQAREEAVGDVQSDIQEMQEKHNEPFCDFYINLLGQLDIHDFREVQLTIHNMLVAALAKFRKDFDGILNYGPELDEITIVTSIQKVESTFSTYRRVEKIDNLAKQKQFSETVFRKNKTLQWVLQNENAEELIIKSSTSKTRNETLKNDKEEDNEMDRVLYNRRLVLQPKLKKRKRVQD